MVGVQLSRKKSEICIRRTPSKVYSACVCPFTGLLPRLPPSIIEGPKQKRGGWKALANKEAIVQSS